MWAAIRGHVEAVKALVAADPDPAHLNMEVSILEQCVCGVLEIGRESRAHSHTYTQ